MITIDILKKICPAGKTSNLAKYVGPLNTYLPQFEINTLPRIRHFVAQVAHESASFNYVEEIASGQAYEGRKDLGNNNPGDGVKFKGRGLIQITGRANYEKCSIALFGDNRLLDHPELLEIADNAVKSASWFWKTKGLNMFADKDDLKAITKRINGGYNGIGSREEYYKNAQKYIA
jgi:putative chitinase